MIGSLIGILLAGLVVGCAVGSEEEQNTAGVLTVNSKSAEVEVPEGMTAKDVDHNSDGTIDIKDLVIVSKFFGQDVPEADAVAEALDHPCGDMEDRYTSFDDIIVKDNTSHKQIFDLDGKKYVYALLGVAKLVNSGKESDPDLNYWNLSASEKARIVAEQSEGYQKYKQHERPSCIAIRFLINDDLLPVTMKIKTVDGFEYPQTISPSSLKIDTRKATTCFPGYCDMALLNDEGLHMSGGNWSVNVLRNFDFTRFVEGDSSGYWQKIYKRKPQVGIPIGDGSVITRLFLKLYEYPVIYSDLYYTWGIFPNPNPNNPFYDFNGRHIDHGVYVNMLPEEVRRRYFPEDIN